MARILEVAPSTEEHEETIEVAHCTHKERQSLTCEGAATSVLSATTGVAVAGSVGANLAAAQVSGTIEAQALRESGLTHQRALGRQYELESPPLGRIRTYRVVYQFKVLRARTELRSSWGRQQQFTHPFVATCAIRAEPVTDSPCPGVVSPEEGLGSAAAEEGGGAMQEPPEVAVVPATPSPAWEHVTVPVGAKVRVRLVDRLGTDANRSEDPFDVVLARDLKVGRITLRKGETTGRGVLTEVAPPGRVKGKAILRLKLTALRLGDLELPLTSSEVKLERSSKGGDWLRRGIGAAVGAGVGAATGGKKGAAVGAGVGVAAGEATNMADRGDQLVINPGKEMEFQLEAPLLIPVRRLR